MLPFQNFSLTEFSIIVWSTSPCSIVQLRFRKLSVFTIVMDLLSGEPLSFVAVENLTATGVLLPELPVRNLASVRSLRSSVSSKYPFAAAPAAWKTLGGILYHKHLLRRVWS